MILTILIPTYNRCNDLKYNLEMLTRFIKEMDAIQSISIMISDNCSKDGTDVMLEKFVSNCEVSISYYIQKTNLGIEKNALYLLKNAKSDYVMFLGDDDYLSIDYLQKVLLYISDKKQKITVIFPNFYGIDGEGRKCSEVRSTPKEDIILKEGSKNLYFLFLAHQLSGLTFLKKKVWDAYCSRKLQNIYPFMFFAGYNLLRGNGVHITQSPVKVTQTNKKFWDYGNDGLLNDTMQNVKKLCGCNLTRFILELQYIYKMHGMATFILYKDKPFIFIKAILKAKNITLFGRIYYGIYMLYVAILLRVLEVKNRL